MYQLAARPIIESRAEFANFHEFQAHGAHGVPRDDTYRCRTLAH